MYRVHGFTLAELMVAIAIGGILVTVGIPSYFNFIQRNTVATTSNDLLGAILYARSEAVRQEATATFTPEADGWLVESGDVTLLDHTVKSDFIAIDGDAVTYSPRGRANLVAERSIDISYKGVLESRVCLNLSGRPFIKMVEDGDCP
ncbi:MAG: prepilin-type N-terminal cleavage/methylation domain-containing protein [gamma proteobacterium symbiont of Clathrolucina costata]|nr:GspH/FimT family pseudopilin [Candidatus Thiodiazotropha sp. (ex Lucina pensylvanica)]MBT3049553.1 GspH/FimT family pseudopilin [Candidatus Thiodiazotropha sp. (ex Codakia orbicularis)]MCW4239058.1 GspH/FimT family pseudopilin [Candidatus Thiodiazotropha endolucinida]